MKFSAFPLAAVAVLAAAACTQKEEPVEEPQVKLETPSAKIIDVGATEATLAWGKVKGALAYHIFAGEDPDPFIAIDTVSVLKGLEPDTDYIFRVQAVPPTRSRYTPSDLSAALNARTLQKPRLSAPAVRVESLASDAFTVVWSPVDSAASYIYSIDPAGLEPASGELTDTLLNFSGLTPDTEYKFSVKAVPSEEFADIYAGGKSAQLNVRTNAIVALAAPTVTVERASSIRSILSWEEVEGAEYYDYSLDDGETLTTTGLSAVFEGLARDSEHVFRVRSCSDNARVYSNSEWVSVPFKAVYDFISSLKIERAVATDNSVTIEISATDDDYYYTGCIPKCLCLEEGTLQVDTAAIVSSALLAIESEGGVSKLPRGASTRVWNEGIYSELSYVCYALGMTSEGTRTGALKTVEVKTSAHEFKPEDGIYMESGDFFSFNPVAAMGYSSTNGLYDGTDYVSMQMKKVGDVTVSEVKYYILPRASFESTIGTDLASIISGMDAYFDGGKGGTLSSLSSVNAGSTVAVGYTKRSAGTEYVLFCRATTDAGAKYYCASTFRTMSREHDWLQLGFSSEGKATIRSAVPVTTGKAKCAGLGSSNNTYDKLASFVSSASPLSDARLSTLNSGGTVDISYSLTAETNYNFVVTLTNTAGDTVVRNYLIRK